MSLLRTLLQPDYEEYPERALIGNAANILQIGEFQLLQLAYFEWYDHDMSDTVTHTMFQAYMVDGKVPQWARQFAQKVVEKSESGTIDINHEYFHRYDQDRRTEVASGVKQFVIASSVIVGLLGGGLVLGHLTAEKGTSVLPPYFDDRDFKGIKKPIDKNTSVLPWQRD